MANISLVNEYLKWLISIVFDEQYSKNVSYKKLLKYLFEVEFVPVNDRDSNRSQDGIELRYKFACERNYSDSYVMDHLKGPCSVLEMMIALSVRCEDHIMDDPDVGDRTGQWFWNMVVTMGLGPMTDNNFDSDNVDYILLRFMNRKYKRNGEGGLFTVSNSKTDFRKIEIWDQLCLYLNEILDL